MYMGKTTTVGKSGDTCGGSSDGDGSGGVKEADTYCIGVSMRRDRSTWEGIAMRTAHVRVEMMPPRQEYPFGDLDQDVTDPVTSDSSTILVSDVEIGCVSSSWMMNDNFQEEASYADRAEVRTSSGRNWNAPCSSKAACLPLHGFFDCLGWSVSECDELARRIG
jgi:hypothetical protein